MQLDLRTIAEFYALALYLLAVLAVVGSPIKLLLVGRTSLGSAVAAPVFGVAIVSSASWLWYGAIGPTKPVVRVLLVVAALASLGVLAWTRQHWRRCWRARSGDETRRSIALLLVVFFGVSGLFFVQQTQLFTRDHITVLSLGNNDVVDYANVSQHMLDEDSTDIGQVSGYDFGDRALGFPGGACAILAAAASATGFDVWKVMQATMFIAIFLGSYSVALLLRQLTSSTVIAGMAAVAGYGVLYATYLSEQWFFAQLLGMALSVAIVSMLRATLDAGDRRSAVLAAFVVGLLIQGGMWVYPHMVVIATLVLVPLAAISLRSPSEFVRRGITAAFVYGAGLVLAVITTPGLARDALDAARDLESVDAGWKLPGILPTELLGFQTLPGAHHGHAAAVVSAVVLLGLAASAVLLWRRGSRRSAEAMTVALVGILASYLVMYVREDGPSYRQWKWLTYFTPVFVALALTLVATAALAGRNSDRWKPFVYACVGGFAWLTIYLASPTTMGLTAPAYSAVTLDQLNLAAAPELADVTALHIDGGEYWDSMWLAYFLRDKEVSIGKPTYYPISEPLSDVWIQRNDSGPPAQGVEVLAILNDTYRLVRHP